jgi:hypothetical protein
MNEEKKPKNGITEAVPLDNQEFRVRMDRIVKALKDAGLTHICSCTDIWKPVMIHILLVKTMRVMRLASWIARWSGSS